MKILNPKEKENLINYMTELKKQQKVVWNRFVDMVEDIPRFRKEAKNLKEWGNKKFNQFPKLMSKEKGKIKWEVHNHIDTTTYNPDCLTCNPSLMSKKQQSDWEKEIGNMKIATFGLKERLKDFPDVMEAISTQIQQARAEGYEEGTKGLPSKGVEEYEREIRQETLKAVLDKIDKVYKQEKGIHHWLDLREEIKLGIKL